MSKLSMQGLVAWLALMAIALPMQNATAQSNGSMETIPKLAKPVSRPLLPMAEKEEIAAVIQMFAGESRVIAQPGVARIAVGSAKVLSAGVLDDKEVLLFANEPGETTLHWWTKSGRSQRVKVIVQASDMARVNDELAQLLGGIGNAKTKIIADKIVVQGDNLRDDEQEHIKMLAARYPQIINFTSRVGWEKMIELDVRVIEIKSDKARQLGIDWQTSTAGPVFSIAGDLKTTSIGAPVITGAGAPSPDDQRAVRAITPTISPFHSYLGLWSILQSQINLLQQQGDVVVVARPTLTTRSGATAEFQVGGQIPYSVSSALGQQTVAFKDYGVQLKITPRVDNTGSIRAELRAEVSEPDPSLNTNGVPGLLTRKVQTEFNVREGETMVLGGMLRRNYNANQRQVPGLGNIPLVGELFKTRSKSDAETETIVFVTPRVVSASDASQIERSDAALRRVNAVINPPAVVTPPAPADKANLSTTGYLP